MGRTRFRVDIAYSVNGVPIRLTDERWDHILEVHGNMGQYHEDCLNVIERPDVVLRGRHGSLKAAKAYGRDNYLVVMYRELSSTDGFVITAYFVRRLNRRDVVWPQ